MHVITFDNVKVDDWLVKTARLNFGERRHVWFRFPYQVANDLTQRSDPWLCVLVFPMMLQGGVIHVAGDVSHSLLDNIEMFSRIWSVWCPELYQPVKIIPERIVEDRHGYQNDRLITAFSGGLDASYTLYKYIKKPDSHRQYRIDKSVMIHGADIPLANPQQFDEAFRAAKIMVNDLDVDLYPVVTNYREYHNNWSYEFGAVMAGTLAFFSGTYATGVASDASVHYFDMPWGMNPVSDQFLSSDTFRFVADGYEHSRTERACLVKDWQACINNLRVCWMNSDKAKNCGKCEKCIRTKLNFFAVGVNHLPSMPNDFSVADLLKKDLVKTHQNLFFYKDIYRFAQNHQSLPEPWMKVLEKQIVRWEKAINSGIYSRKRKKLFRLHRHFSR